MNQKHKLMLFGLLFYVLGRAVGMMTDSSVPMVEHMSWVVMIGGVFVFWWLGEYWKLGDY